MSEDTGTSYKASGDREGSHRSYHSCASSGQTGNISSLSPMTETRSLPSLSIHLVEKILSSFELIGEKKGYR